MNHTAIDTASSKARKHSPPVFNSSDSSVPRSVPNQSCDTSSKLMVIDLASLNNESIQCGPLPILKDMALRLRLVRAKRLRIQPCRFKIPPNLLRSTFIEHR